MFQTFRKRFTDDWHARAVRVAPPMSISSFRNARGIAARGHPGSSAFVLIPGACPVLRISASLATA